MYDDLLLATDGGEGARRATDHAIALADRLTARLHLLSVTETAAHDTQDELRTDHEREALEAVEAAEHAADNAGLTTETAIVSGIPQEEIVAFAEREPVDLIVLGTAGRTGLDQFLLGSVAEAVVRNAPVPVVTVRERT